MAVVNPYIEIQKKIKESLGQDIQTAGTTAVGDEQKAYIGKMQSQRKLNSSLAQQGINGGASESAILGSEVGYQNQKNLIGARKANTIMDLQRNADANLLTTNTQSAEWEAQKQAQDETRFAQTITGYDTVQKVDKAMEAAVTAGEDWKLGYLRAQRAALMEKAAGATSSSGGGGGEKTQDELDAEYKAMMDANRKRNINTMGAGGISGTQGGMTSTYYPTRPLLNRVNPSTTQKSRNPYLNYR